MTTLAEIEAALEQLPPTQQAELYVSLGARLKRSNAELSTPPHAGHGVLEITRVSVGQVLRSFVADKGLLDEMLGGRA